MPWLESFVAKYRRTGTLASVYRGDGPPKGALIPPPKTYVKEMPY